MILGINQPTFFPWLGFFDLLRSCDMFVFLDNVQVSKQSFIVRNRILAPDGTPRWITAPLKKHPLKTDINDVRFSSHTWFQSIKHKIVEYYKKAKYFEENAPKIISVLEESEKTLSEYNIKTIVQLYYLIFGENLSYIEASEIQNKHSSYEKPLDRILYIIDSIGGVGKYYNSKTGIEQGLYSCCDFKKRKISVFKQDYQCISYSQVGKVFVPYLSIIDLMLNEPSDRWAGIIKRGSRWIQVC